MGEVSKGVVAGKQYRVRHSGDGLICPLIQLIQLLLVDRNVVGDGGLQLIVTTFLGDLFQGVADVGNLNLGVLRRGPYVRIEAKFRLLTGLFRREWPWGDINLFHTSVNGVVTILRLLCRQWLGFVHILGRLHGIYVTCSENATGHCHRSGKARGLNRLVQEVLQIDSVDEQEIGVTSLGQLLMGHFQLMCCCIRRQQAGQINCIDVQLLHVITNLRRGSHDVDWVLATGSLTAIATRCKASAG